MNILIIDDEIHCSDILKFHLETLHPGKYDISVCNQPKEAIKLLVNSNFNIVFLDIEMPFLNGFDILETLPEINFNIVFTTAFDKYALKAIKFSALDYLLKPIDIEELAQTLLKVEKNNLSNQNTQFNSLIENIKHKTFNKIAVPNMEGIDFIEINDIIRCHSDGNYTKLFLVQNKCIVASKTLKEFENILKESGFARVHNCDIINLKHMKKYIKGDGGVVVMNDGSEVEVSRRRKEEFLSQL